MLPHVCSKSQRGDRPGPVRSVVSPTKDSILDLVPSRQPQRYSCCVRYHPNSSPLFPVQGRRYVLAAVISVGEHKLPRRRTSQASRVSDLHEQGTWTLKGACGLDRITNGKIQFFSTHPYTSSLLLVVEGGGRGATKAFLDRNIREFAVCSATLTDWNASRLHAPIVMEVCSLRFRASC
jgi:hypothetical protein